MSVLQGMYDKCIKLFYISIGLISYTNSTAGRFNREIGAERGSFRRFLNNHRHNNSFITLYVPHSFSELHADSWALSVFELGPIKLSITGKNNSPWKRPKATTIPNICNKKYNCVMCIQTFRELSKMCRHTLKNVRKT